MKTKSKRFLNLATLCLALLGTTLLMTCPVKAEGPTKRDRVEDQERDDPYQKGVRDGHRAGYEQGRQDRQTKKGSSDASPTPPSKAPDPESNPYKEEDDKRRYRLGWDTMYTSGYYQGWHQQKDYQESDYGQNEEEEEDVSDTPSSQDSTEQDSTEQDSTEQDSTDDGFYDLIDMVVVGITTLFWGLVSSWF
ncbi:TPA: hypothetical protein VNE75_000701 [Streptococcus pyogenes]|uniref:hypothetical protein n=1 Tax=Streptococcus pyogenes TaxID=1314 RepID=UPI000DA2F797|nr:hypothetical protein [Streptococcus pyogenes]SQF63363.1 hypothetical membrane associated protein [Streptococcus pyogenes]VGS38730.1 hypothetical membrane associated protein [Streptococcus pyogenes]VGS73349.1 hypothetical membrane associated protein [Streptococcus pyogenes]VHI71643.1 hypothetical membrane associated protein [Streptococcus pyogenes]HEQ1201057.1 hypothetical protein [Streptococcus pyogenes]